MPRSRTALMAAGCDPSTDQAKCTLDFCRCTTGCGCARAERQWGQQAVPIEAF
ncbi:hypothetical protein EKH55_3521 [Sinorhizobium alkalisoli]|nr:hypothetical protein EKH55_3521 [Sinorhizobium alkalisoli]